MRLFLHKWHRRIGIVAALFVLMLAVTGVLLNHTDYFNLAKIHMQSSAILDWYDVRPPEPPVSFEAEGNRITLIGGRLYFNETELPEGGDELFGAVPWDGRIIVALDGKMLMLSRRGEVVEKLTGTQGVPAGLSDIGLTSAGDLVVRGSHGDYRVDMNTLDWRERDVVEARWSTATPLPEGLHSRLLAQYRGKGLTLERVLLDLHSGRILGRFGVYLVDIAALLFVVLALSGAWMWLGRRR